MTAVRVTVITFRRPQLLKRALESVVSQSFADWRVEVLNDDPQDPEPSRVVESIRDSRMSIVEPAQHRGGTANLNYAFRGGSEPFGSILEDDNWWQPDFLSATVSALRARPEAVLITANERIWQERPGNSWVATGQTLRPERDVVWDFALRPEDKCGQAVLANSAMVYRLDGVASGQLPPTLPIDVTEHYRERVIPHPILVHDRVLVNFAQTLQSARSQDVFEWSKHQVLLTGSVFAALSESARSQLAERLLAGARNAGSLHLTGLLLTGLFVPAASPLWRMARVAERLRIGAHLVRRPHHISGYRRLLTDCAPAWRFLQTGWVADALRASPGRS